MMTESELAAARSETVEGIGGCLVRISKAVHLLTLAQRIALAEIARDLGDALDEGKILTLDERRKPRRRFVRTHYQDATGAALYREVIRRR
jgi:hypothetical protein